MEHSWKDDPWIDELYHSSDCDSSDEMPLDVKLQIIQRRSSTLHMKPDHSAAFLEQDTPVENLCPDSPEELGTQPSDCRPPDSPEPQEGQDDL